MRSFNECLRFTCYHSTWQNEAPTTNNCNAQAKRKFQEFRYWLVLKQNLQETRRCFTVTKNVFKSFFFMDSMVETSNSMAEYFLRSKLSTAGGH